jgi:hypothetical protein
MNNDRVKLKRLEPSLKKIVKWRREVQEKLETEKVGLSPAEILNTEKWYEGLKTAENAIYCLELIYRRRLMDQTAFAEPDNKIQKVKQANESRGTKIFNKNQERSYLGVVPPSIPVISIKSTLDTLGKSSVPRKRVVKPKLTKKQLGH